RRATASRTENAANAATGRTPVARVAADEEAIVPGKAAAKAAAAGVKAAAAAISPVRGRIGRDAKAGAAPRAEAAADGKAVAFPANVGTAGRSDRGRIERSARHEATTAATAARAASKAAAAAAGASQAARVRGNGRRATSSTGHFG